jgi:uncharacterized protein (DUF4415 family)
MSKKTTDDKGARDHRPARPASRAEISEDVSAQKGWRSARHVIDAVNAKLPTRRVTINLDEDLLAVFKAEALRGGPPYQVAINQALRAYLHSREASEEKRAVQVLLTALDDAAVRRKLRSIR